jgi:hypothetical protein
MTTRARLPSARSRRTREGLRSRTIARTRAFCDAFPHPEFADHPYGCARQIGSVLRGRLAAGICYSKMQLDTPPITCATRLLYRILGFREITPTRKIRPGALSVGLPPRRSQQPGVQAP